jgi:hypothetical protein
MGAIWKRIFGKSKEPLAQSQEWVCISVKLADGNFGNLVERQEIQRFGDVLESKIKENELGTFDGDGFGGGEGQLFMHGPDAEALFSTVEPLLRAWPPMKGGYVIKQYGGREFEERVDF